MLTIEEGKNERSIIKALHDCLSETAHHVLPESALSNERKKIKLHLNFRLEHMSFMHFFSTKND